MKIAVLTSGILPVPAVKGGAVENLIDFCLEYNNNHRLHDITIYSINNPKVKNLQALNSTVNHYHYIEANGLFAKIKKRIVKQTLRNSYYHYTVEYFLQQACNHIYRQHYDVILIENRPGFILKVKDYSDAKLVIHQENDYLNDQMPFYKEIYEAASCIINTSDYLTNRVRTIDANTKKCQTVLNGIDTERFYQAKPLPRKVLQLDNDDFVIVYSGRLTQEKGILELIKAISLLQEIPKLKLLVIGASFYGKDKTATPFVNKLIEASATVKDKVIFTGYVDYSKIPSYLKAADVAVVPSLWEEPFGLTVIEAMAAGLPLVTTNSGGIPESCYGVATIVNRDNLVNNLANAIHDLYEHPEKRAAMSKAALERSKLFDKDIYAKNFFKALEDGVG